MMADWPKLPRPDNEGDERNQSENIEELEHVTNDRCSDYSPLVCGE
jgi:hypothetical protein